jgi:hypothetical protein
MPMSLARRLNQEPEILSATEADPCPFCGSPAQIEFWHGGRPSKRMVSCSNQGDTLFRPAGRHIGCHASPSVTGETKAQALDRWNTRATHRKP